LLFCNRKVFLWHIAGVQPGKRDFSIWAEEKKPYRDDIVLTELLSANTISGNLNTPIWIIMLRITLVVVS